MEIAALPNRNSSARILSIKSKHRLRVRAYSSLLIGDTVAIILGFLSANLIRFGEVYHTQGLSLLGVILPIFLLLSAYSGAYGMSAINRPLAGLRRAAQAFALSVGSVAFIVYFLRVSEIFSRLTFGIGICFGIVLLIIFRNTITRFSISQMDGSPTTTIVVRDEIDFMPNPTDIVFDAKALRIDPRLQDPKMLDRFALLIGEADRVIIACPTERYDDWQMLLKGLNLQGEIFFSDLLRLGPVGLGRHNSLPTLVISEGPLSVRDRAVKRLFDIGLSLFSLVILFPILLLTAIAIKLDSPGPVFFQQERIGRGNRIFKIVKFRSMFFDRSDGIGNKSTARNDSRVTRVGNLIRRTSVDELPQLLNVLAGDMSIVGPRPHALGSTAEQKLFWEIDRRYWHRHAIKPGLTGLAQIRGFRGATHMESDLLNRLQSDLEYVAGWTIWKDVGILASTFKVVVHRNAF